MSKRFQECNWLVKLWRYRHYVYVPFKWLWYSYIRPLHIPENGDGELCDNTLDAISSLTKSKNLWSILVGSAQCDMNWTYTSDEVWEYINKKKDE